MSIFHRLEDPDDYKWNMDNHDLVADIDSDTLIRILKFLKGKLRSKRKFSSNERA